MHRDDTDTEKPKAKRSFKDIFLGDYDYVQLCLVRTRDSVALTRLEWLSAFSEILVLVCVRVPGVRTSSALENVSMTTTTTTTSLAATYIHTPPLSRDNSSLHLFLSMAPQF